MGGKEDSCAEREIAEIGSGHWGLYGSLVQGKLPRISECDLNEDS